MDACPQCGSKELLRDLSRAKSSTDIRSFFQYYRCTECNLRFSRFAPGELYGRIIPSTGLWYIGFAMFILLLVLGLKWLFSTDSDPVSMGVASSLLLY